MPGEYRTAFVKARVGKTKTNLTQESPQCCMSDVVSALGQYIEFSVNVTRPSGSGHDVPSTSSSQQLQNVGTQNAFRLLIASSRQTASLSSNWEIKISNKKLEMENLMMSLLFSRKTS